MLANVLIDDQPLGDRGDPRGGLDAGRFSTAYAREPRTHVLPARLATATSDVPMEHLTSTSSTILAVPPGVRPGERAGPSLVA